MNPEIFREYDIRGIAGKDIFVEEVELLGRAIGTFMLRNGCRRMAVGRDCRVTSDDFAGALMDGLVSTGCQVADIGVCPTPVLYFSIQHLNQESGIMVTASHNPKEYNGFKICMGSDSVHGKDLQIIREIVSSGRFLEGQGARTTLSSVIPQYQRFIEDNIILSRPLRVGVDAGNGTAGVVAVPILKNLNCEVHELYCKMDGNFPNHEADPTVLANMKDLIALVQQHELDVGIGYDGDGDRIGVVDEKGNIVYGDKLMVLFAREILSRRPGAVFISEVKCSQVMYDEIEKRGGRAVMWKTGHSLIKAKMKEERAALAGEMSGHMFFEDRYLGFDDAVYASCRLLEILSATGRKMSDLLSDLPHTYTTPEIRVDCPDNRKFHLVDKVTRFFKARYEVIDIDGARILFDGGWGLVRASNTQPALVLRFEAMSRERLEEIRGQVESVIQEMEREETG